MDGPRLLCVWEELVKQLWCREGGGPSPQCACVERERRSVHIPPLPCRVFLLRTERELCASAVEASQSRAGPGRSQVCPLLPLSRSCFSPVYFACLPLGGRWCCVGAFCCCSFLKFWPKCRRRFVCTRNRNITQRVPSSVCGCASSFYAPQQPVAAFLDTKKNFFSFGRAEHHSVTDLCVWMTGPF